MPTMNITFTTAQTARIADAFQFALELPAPATAADIKAYIIGDLTQVVRSAEKREAAADYLETATDVDFT